VAVILDIAAKLAAYDVAAAMSKKEQLLKLQRIMWEQREILRRAGREGTPRALSAEFLF
jgi:hypothetical protein